MPTVDVRGDGAANTSSTPAALRISELWKHYEGVPVVKGISLEIQPGEIFGLLGPNGAGKSTTINIVSGVARLERGKVEVFGHDNQRDYKATRRAVGVMHQEIVIDPFFKIGRALQIHAGFYGLADDPEWRDLLIERLALGPHVKKTMHKLSGGMKRRFMVAKALIHKPRLLILDEPTAGVDVELRLALWEFVREINAKGTTILLTTHYLEEAEQICGRVAIMNEGKIVALDHTKHLLGRVEKLRLDVRLGRMPDKLPDELERFQPEARDGGRLMQFRLADESEVPVILHSLWVSGAVIEGVQTTQPSLEDVFLKLTGRATHNSKRAGE